MKQKRFMAWFLMAVSILMLAASVIPHHHHREVLCMQHDVEECNSTSSSSSNEKKSSEECRTCCVTKFFCSAPQDDANEVPSVYLSAITLFSIADILDLVPSVKDNNINAFSYIESIYATRAVSASGLRAPPTLS